MNGDTIVGDGGIGDAGCTLASRNGNLPPPRKGDGLSLFRGQIAPSANEIKSRFRYFRR
jgi:hypothetical protein